MIPRFTETVKFITDALDEKDREEFSRLKVIKRQKQNKENKQEGLNLSSKDSAFHAKTIFSPAKELFYNFCKEVFTFTKRCVTINAVINCMFTFLYGGYTK